MLANYIQEQTIALIPIINNEIINFYVSSYIKSFIFEKTNLFSQKYLILLIISSLTVKGEEEFLKYLVFVCEVMQPRLSWSRPLSISQL